MADRSSRLPRLLAGAAALAGVAVYLAPPPPGIAVPAMHALGVVVLVVGLWATAAIPVHLTSFIFFFLAITLSLAPPGLAFSGFAAGATWLVFGGIVIGIAVQRTGLGTRIANGLVRLLPRSYPGTIAGIVVACVGLAFVLPSAMGRVVILIPIVQALAERLGFAAGSRGRHGMAMAVGTASMIPGMSILPATTPNVVLAGAAESTLGLVLRYGEFLIANGPVAGILTAPVLVALIVWIFPDRAGPRAEELPPPGPLTAAERRLAVVLALTLGMWATDVVHGIAPAWVALGAAIVCMLPVTRLVPAEAVAHEVNYSPWFMLAGILGMAAMVTHTGLSGVIGKVMFALVPFAHGADAWNFGLMVLLESLLAVLITFPSVPAILTPLAPDLAAATGWPLATAVMSQVPGFLAIYLPYEAPPIFTAMLMARVPYGLVVRLTLAFSAIYLATIAPLTYLWWQALGLFG